MIYLLYNVIDYNKTNISLKCMFTRKNICKKIESIQI